LLIKDSDPNQILNIQSLGANNIELQNKEIKRFRAEGKTGADMLEKLIDNVASKAGRIIQELFTKYLKEQSRGSLKLKRFLRQ
jgi:type II restriction/modification system DNA methylase subunit YeeA